MRLTIFESKMFPSLYGEIQRSAMWILQFSMLAIKCQWNTNRLHVATAEWNNFSVIPSEGDWLINEEKQKEEAWKETILSQCVKAFTYRQATTCIVQSIRKSTFIIYWKCLYYTLFLLIRPESALLQGRKPNYFDFGSRFWLTFIITITKKFIHNLLRGK